MNECKVCGKLTRWNTCSHRCKWLNHKRKEPPTKICKVCGESFVVRRQDSVCHPGSKEYERRQCCGKPECRKQRKSEVNRGIAEGVLTREDRKGEARAVYMPTLDEIRERKETIRNER
jgi:hypothetical protein